MVDLRCVFSPSRLRVFAPLRDIELRTAPLANRFHAKAQRRKGAKGFDSGATACAGRPSRANNVTATSQPATQTKPCASPPPPRLALAGQAVAPDGVRRLDTSRLAAVRYQKRDAFQFVQCVITVTRSSMPTR